MAGACSLVILKWQHSKVINRAWLSCLNLTVWTRPDNFIFQMAIELPNWSVKKPLKRTSFLWKGFSSRLRRLTNFAGTAFNSIGFARQALLMPVDKNGCKWAIAAWAGCLPIFRRFRANMYSNVSFTLKDKEKGWLTFLFMVANDDIANLFT